MIRLARTMRAILSLATASLTLLLTLAGCGSGPPAPAKPPATDEISIRMMENPITLDPALATRTLDGHLTSLVHGGLVRGASHGRIIGELAQSWEMLPGNLGIRFRLKPNLTFPSGAPLTSRDVARSFSRIVDRKTASPHAWIFEDVSGVAEFSKGATEAVSGFQTPAEDCFEIHLVKPSATLLARLSMPAARLVDMREVNRQGEAYGRNPRGLGAWEIQEWVDDSHLAFSSNPLYPGRNEHLQTLRFLLATQDFSANALFETGRLHVLMPLPMNLDRKWKSSPEWLKNIHVNQEMNLYYLGIGCHRPPFDQLEVRQAIAARIDPEPIRKALYGDRTLPALGPSPPALSAGIQPISREIIHAERPIPEALKGRQVELWFIDSEAAVSLAMEAVQAALRKSGIDCRLRKTDPATYASWRRAGKFDLFFANWWADYPDPDNFYGPLFLTGSSSNHTRFSDAEYDRIIHEAAAEADAARRTMLYRSATMRLSELAPAIFLWHRNTEILLQPWVEGFEPAPIFNSALFLKLRIKRG